MHIEINVALNFVMNQLYNKLPRRRVHLFGEELEKALKSKFVNHWYPDRPMKGSAYRCIKTGQPTDTVFVLAASEANVPIGDIIENLPSEMSIWIDPGEVSYRIGEKSSIKVLWSTTMGTATANMGHQNHVNGGISGTSPTGNGSLNGHGHVGDTMRLLHHQTSNMLMDDLAADREVKSLGFNETALEVKSFNPDAQVFQPISSSTQPSMTTSSNGSIDSRSNKSVSPPFNASPTNNSNSSFSLFGGPSNGIANGVVKCNTTVGNGTTLMTTAAFAQTKFGSTKLKTSSKRTHKMSPTEFSNYIKQRALAQQQAQAQQQQQQQGFMTHHNHINMNPHQLQAAPLIVGGSPGQTQYPNMIIQSNRDAAQEDYRNRPRSISPPDFLINYEKDTSYLWNSSSEKPRTHKTEYNPFESSSSKIWSNNNVNGLIMDDGCRFGGAGVGGKGSSILDFTGIPQQTTQQQQQQQIVA